MLENQGIVATKNKDSLGKESFIGKASSEVSFVNLDEWFAIKFSAPFLSFIVMLNSCSNKIHCINLGFASCFDIKYLTAA